MSDIENYRVWKSRDAWKIKGSIVNLVGNLKAVWQEYGIHHLEKEISNTDKGTRATHIVKYESM